MTKQDIKMRYLGSYMGILWAFINPLFTIVIMWFVFDVGFKSAPVENFPFILWLMTGMIPWFFISDAILSASGSIVENSFLVKKIVFRVSLLPLIKVLSALIIHLFFLCFLQFMHLIYGFTPTIYSLQIFYYLFASICFVTGIAWITSSLVVFVRDIGQAISVIVQMLFWATPIFWSLQMVPQQFRSIFLLNPIEYIVDGYRDALIYQKWFWDKPIESLYFWGVTLFILFTGVILFRRLKAHFADVL